MKKRNMRQVALRYRDKKIKDCGKTLVPKISILNKKNNLL